jgi:hypothetical protein
MFMDLPPPSHYECVIDSSNYEYFQEGLNKAKAIRVKNQAFNFMRQLEGWCSEKKAGVLIDLVLKTQPETILEIGVYGGKSLVPMACAVKENKRGKVYGIDPWEPDASLEDMHNDANRDYWGKLNYNKILGGLIQKIATFDLKNQIELIRNTSANAPIIYNIDVLHIDGNHSDATSWVDVTKWVPFVRSGGWIIFDDMTWYENGIYTTGRAVQYLDQYCKRVATFSDNCDWGIWQKP